MIFLVALTVRLGYVSAGYEAPPQDTPDYDEIAMNLLRGEGFVARENWHGFEVRSWRPPFYPVFLSFVYGIFGHSHLVVRIIQCFVGALTALLVYKTGHSLACRAAPLAGAITAVYGPLIASANEVMTEVWFAFWLVLGAWLLVDRGRETGDGRRETGFLGRGIARHGCVDAAGGAFFCARDFCRCLGGALQETVPPRHVGLAGRACGAFSVDASELHGTWPLAGYLHPWRVHSGAQQCGRSGMAAGTRLGY